MKNLLAAFMCDKELVQLFTKSFFDYRKIENSVIDDFKNLSFYEDIEVKKLNPTDGFAKNFFTLFMISLMKNSEIRDEKLISYGKIIYFLRAMVTAIDNLIDDEEKGVVFFNNIDEKTTNNSLISLQMQNLLTSEIFKLSPDEAVKANAEIMNDLFVIAKSESLRCRDAYLEYPKYEFILENINYGIGGKLLKIGLTIPCYLEKNEKLDEFSRILFDMGVELQALDDLCDMKEDYQNNKTNLATAFFMEKLNRSEEEIVNLDVNHFNVAKLYLRNILHNVFEGFDKLEKLGYPINHRDAEVLLRRLFELRGLEDKWKLVSGEV